jgi:hypothetical protein
VPAWLNEGLSVYAQRTPGAGYEQAVELAVRRDRALSIRSISSSPGDPSLVNLFYGQSGSIVEFLIETYGEAKMAEFLATFKKGARTDDAVRAVYGVDLNGLENAWRQSVGLKPRAPGSTDDSSSQTQPVPTIVPIGSEGRVAPTAAVSGEQREQTAAPAEGQAPVLTIVLIAVLALLFISGIAGGLFVLVRRYR